MPRWVHPCWKTLGIAPTPDQREIRVAYTALLKAIDPDSDPQGFIALREAYEAARVQAQWVKAPGDADDETDDDEGEDWEEDWSFNVAPNYDQVSPITGRAPEEISLAPPVVESEVGGTIRAGDLHPAPVSPSPWTPESPKAADDHARALASLFYARDAENESYATPEQAEAMLAHWQAIAADPRMQEVSFYADAERWVSELLAYATPFSDPLIVPATKFFSWAATDGSITQSHATALITRRAGAIRFMEEVAKPGHPLHAAWVELRRPADERSRRGMVNARSVQQLLEIIRHRYPDVEGALDYYRVGLWDGSVDSGFKVTGGGVWAVIVAIIFIIRACSSLDTATPPPSSSESGYQLPSETRGATGSLMPASQLTSAPADLDQGLMHLFGQEQLMSRIGQLNPPLREKLIAFWDSENARGVTRKQFIADLRQFVERWYLQGVRHGDDVMLVAFHRLTIDMATALLRSDPAGCRTLFTVMRLLPDDVTMPSGIFDRQNALVINTLLYTDGTLPKQAGKPTVPGKIVTAAAERAGQTPEQMSKTLMLGGTDTQLCSGRIAFMETVLALPPKERMPLMRVM